MESEESWPSTLSDTAIAEILATEPGAIAEPGQTLTASDDHGKHIEVLNGMKTVVTGKSCQPISVSCLLSYISLSFV